LARDWSAAPYAIEKAEVAVRIEKRMIDNEFEKERLNAKRK
jgi:hypothetical protein